MPVMHICTVILLASTWSTYIEFKKLFHLQKRFRFYGKSCSGSLCIRQNCGRYIHSRCTVSNLNCKFLRTLASRKVTNLNFRQYCISVKIFVTVPVPQTFFYLSSARIAKLILTFNSLIF